MKSASTKKPTGTRRKRKAKKPKAEEGFFDWLAPHYDRLQPILDPSRFCAHAIVLDILNALDPPPERILDLGCGTGMLAQQILELLPDAHVYGIDGSLAMLEAARENLIDFTDRITLAQADFRDPWEEVIAEPLDAVVHYSSLHHLPHPALREVYSRLVGLLKPGGWFIHGEILEQPLPEPVEQIARSIANLQTECARADLEEENLLDELEEVRQANKANGTVADVPAMAEQQVAWLLEAGFEFAVRVFQDWQVSIFLARKPE